MWGKLGTGYILVHLNQIISLLPVRDLRIWLGDSRLSKMPNQS